MKLRGMFGAALALALLAGPLVDEARAEEEALVSFQVLTPEVALEAAQVALAHCRELGFQVAVSVVDRFGNAQVMIRDRFAGAHTPDTAWRKAWTAVSFRSDTLELAEISQPGQPQSGVRQVTNALMLGGGVQIEAAGSLVGGIGVSGAPGGEADADCGKAGIAAIADRIAF